MTTLSSSRRLSSRAALAAAALGLFASPAGAQTAEAATAESTSPRCEAAEHRQFDFWLGEWEVRSPEGELIGHNAIRRVAGGCGLLEDWRGLGGGAGMSLNAYDVEGGLWTQRWVGSGASLWLEGGLEEGRMVLAGAAPRPTPRGEVLDRITWTPLPDGRVRQDWEVSTDGGETWGMLFQGFYARAAE